LARSLLRLYTPRIFAPASRIPLPLPVGKLRGERVPLGAEAVDVVGGFACVMFEFGFHRIRLIKPQA
jgi:hypothetical protein